jgi:hypothetical protein
VAPAIESAKIDRHWFAQSVYSRQFTREVTDDRNAVIESKNNIFGNPRGVVGVSKIVDRTVRRWVVG